MTLIYVCASKLHYFHLHLVRLIHLTLLLVMNVQYTIVPGKNANTAGLQLKLTELLFKFKKNKNFSQFACPVNSTTMTIFLSDRRFSLAKYRLISFHFVKFVAFAEMMNSGKKSTKYQQILNKDRKWFNVYFHSIRITVEIFIAFFFGWEMSSQHSKMRRISFHNEHPLQHQIFVHKISLHSLL